MIRRARIMHLLSWSFGIKSRRLFEFVLMRRRNGLSYNDIQLIGRKLQPDLVMQLLKFRQHKFCITADISQMCLNILIQEEDRKYQRSIILICQVILSKKLNTIRLCLGEHRHHFWRSESLCNLRRWRRKISSWFGKH